MEATRIVIAGAAGRMGHALTRCATASNTVRLVGAVENTEHPDCGKDAGTVAGLNDLGLPITDDIRGTLAAGADVLIDFTFHTAAPANAELAAELGVAIVMGTTGLDKGETAAVQAAAGQVPIVWAPNMSLGVNLLFAMVRQAGMVLGSDYRVELDETHHVHKKDAPSGTALHLGKKVAEGRSADFDSVMIHDEDGSVRDAPQDSIVIRSHREGEVVGEHTVSFGNAGERIEFTHHAHNREAFAMGALRAATWVRGRAAALYDMQDVLGL